MPSQSTVARRRLGRRLRELRGDRPGDEVGTALREVAPRGRWSAHKVSRIETGTIKAAISDVRTLLDYYGITDDGERRALLALTREAQQVGWWHEYQSAIPEGMGSFLDLESEAAEISTYEESLVPGLLQAEGYVRALMRSGQFTDSDDEIERRVEARIMRREVLDREHPPQMHVVLEEGVIRRQIGGRKIMRDQLARLLEVAKQLTVDLQVVPYGAGAHSASTSFTLFSLDDDPSAVHVDLIGSSIYVERPGAVALYREAFRSATAAALSPAESARLIAAVIEE